jgi:hypothetical protein
MMAELVLHQVEEFRNSSASAKKAWASNFAEFSGWAHRERAWIYKAQGAQITLIESYGDNPQKYPALLHSRLALYFFPRPWLFPSFWITNRKAPDDREL